jgi:hypothetical protein
LIEQIEGMEAPAQSVNEMGPDEHAEIENPRKTVFFRYVASKVLMSGENMKYGTMLDAEC